MYVRDSAHKYVVSVPAEFTKTGIPYSWMVEPADEWLLQAIKNVPRGGHKTTKVLKENVSRFFKDHIMT